MLNLKNRSIKVFVFAFAVFIVLAIACIVIIRLPIVQYNYALSLLEDGDIQEAYDVLYPMGDYKDNLDVMKKFEHRATSELITYHDGKTEKHKYSYHENGNLSTEEYTATNGDKTTYTYYKNGNKKSVFTNKSGEIKNINYTYDSNGNLIKETSYDTFGKFSYSTIYEYDQENKLIKECHGLIHDLCFEYLYDNNGNFLKCVDSSGNILGGEYIYDEKGNLIQEKEDIFLEGNLITTYEYSYDKNNNLIKTKSNDGYIIEGEYNDDALIKVISKKEGDSYAYITDIEYDQNGNIIKTVNKVTNNGEIDARVVKDNFAVRKPVNYYRVHRGPMSIYVDDIWFYTVLNSTTEHTYNSNGNLLKSVTTDLKGNLVINEKVYDSNGILTKSFQSKNGELCWMQEYKYDLYGNLIEKIEKNSDGHITKKIQYSDFVAIKK